MSLIRSLGGAQQLLWSRSAFHGIRHGVLRQNLSTTSIIPFKLADIGEGIAEVELMKWFIKEGDNVKAFDRLCEVQSDKATVEITSRYAGKISKVHHAEGSIVKVGAALIDIEVVGAAGTEKPKEQPAKEIAKPHSEKSHESNHSSIGRKHTDHHHHTKIGPAVRKIAMEKDIDLSKVKGSGPKGRIVKSDVLNYINGKHQSDVTANKTVEKPLTKENDNISKVHESKDRIVPIRGIQRLMVKSMNAANQVKHLTLGEEIHMDSLTKVRDILRPWAMKNGGIKLSYMPLMVKAISLALRDYPNLNATVTTVTNASVTNASVTNEVDVSHITYHASHNIGIAMDTSKGLIVPVIHNVESKSILTIATELNQLQTLASQGKITDKQLQHGTFTLSNIGSVGGTYAVPVLVVPQVAIGAMGRVIQTPQYVNRNGRIATYQEIHNGDAEVKLSRMMNLSWSADHRVVDGATVAKFSNAFKTYMESPELMMLDLK